MEDIVKLRGELESALKAQHADLRAFIEKANGEIQSTGTASVETKNALEKVSVDVTKMHDRLLSLEQRTAAQHTPDQRPATLGEQFTKSDTWSAMAAGRAGKARMEVKTAIVNVNPLTNDQPLVAAARIPGIISPFARRLTIRDLLPVGNTSSNLVEFAKENTFTNNAGPQYSSPNRENVTKPESGITFELANTPVVTLAHWIPASRQILDDAPMLASYINTRLVYGLKLEEEDQLLNGDGTGGNIGGLLKSGNYTAYNRTTTGDNKLDALRRAITQCQLSEFAPDGIVVNPADWEAIELLKTANEKEYQLAQATMGMMGPSLWGMPVVVTNSIAGGSFVVAAFAMAAQIWDRQQAAVEVSRENSDNFVKNMVTILAEERLALAVYRPTAVIKGTY